MKTNFKIEPKVTLAATAMGIYRKLFNQIPEWRCDYEDEIRPAYMGGRCEIFKMSGDNLRCYDINSMYPAVMQSEKYPWGKPNRRVSGPFSFGGCGFVKCRVRCPEIDIPLLPIRLKGKMLFLLGKIEGTWTFAEIRKAIEIGYTIEKVFWTITYPNSGPVFTDWVDYTYGKRKASKNEAERYILKILLNSLYGKFGQNREREEIVFDGSGDSIVGCRPISLSHGIFAKEKIVNSSHIMPQIAAYVTSYARLALYKYLTPKTCYTDTDSVFTRDEIVSTNELGGMKLEKEIQSAEFILPKVYRLRECNGGKSIKAKGFGRLSDSSFDTLIRKEVISEHSGIQTFKTAMMGAPGTIVKKKQVDKRLRSGYIKRRVLSDGSTEPHTIKSFLKAYEKDKKKRG